ncbi:MAG: hypothetical protein HYX82_02095 [Chloroflexi bacterium]|nr:hypothetical protein [Chloroflexota bacterium]
MTGLLAGLGLAFDYTGESVLTISPSHWGRIGLIASGIFVLLTAIREIDLALQQKPEIIVKPQIHNGRAILEVRNIGGEANFTAKARVIATVPERELYTMYWESVRDISCHIDGDGGIASILVGEKAKRDVILKGEPLKSILRGGIELFKMGTSGEQTFSVFSGERSIERIGDKLITEGKAIARCIVEVTITATPRLKSKWGTHKYLLEIDENGILRFDETQLSVPHIINGC